MAIRVGVRPWWVSTEHWSVDNGDRTRRGEGNRQAGGGSYWCYLKHPLLDAAVSASRWLTIQFRSAQLKSVHSVSCDLVIVNSKKFQLVSSLNNTWIRKRQLLRKLRRPKQQQRLQQRSLSQWVMLRILLRRTWRSSSPCCLSTAIHTGIAAWPALKALFIRLNTPL